MPRQYVGGGGSGLWASAFGDWAHHVMGRVLVTTLMTLMSLRNPADRFCHVFDVMLFVPS